VASTKYKKLLKKCFALSLFVLFVLLAILSVIWVIDQAPELRN